MRKAVRRLLIAALIIGAIGALCMGSAHLLAIIMQDQIIGANIGAGLLWLAGMGLVGVAATLLLSSVIVKFLAR